VNGGRYSSGVLLAGTFEAPIFVAVAVLAPYIYMYIYKYIYFPILSLTPRLPYVGHSPGGGDLCQRVGDMLIASSTQGEKVWNCSGRKCR